MAKRSRKKSSKRSAAVGFKTTAGSSSPKVSYGTITYTPSKGTPPSATSPKSTPNKAEKSAETDVSISAKRRIRSLRVAWSRFFGKGKWPWVVACLAIFLAILAPLVDLHDLGTTIKEFLDPNSRPAEKRDVDRILDTILKRLDEDGRGQSPATKAELDAEIRRVLQLGLSGDEAQRAAVELLRDGRIDEAVNRLLASAQQRQALAESAKQGAIGDLYLAALITSYRNYDRSIEIYKRVLALDATYTPAIIMMAQVYINKGELSYAARLIEPIVNQSTLSGRYAYSLNNIIGLLNLYGGNLTSAEMFFRKALVVAQGSHEKWEQAAVLGNLGSVYSKAGNPDKAKTYFNLSLSVNEGRDATLSANAHCNLGSDYLRKNDFKQAEFHFQKSLEIFARAEDKTCLVTTIAGLATVRYFTKNFSEAEIYYRQALSLAESRGSTNEQVMMGLNLASVLHDESSAEAAAQLIRAFDLAVRSDGSSEAFGHHDMAVTRLLEYAQKGGGLRSLAAARRVLSTAISATPDSDRVKLWALNMDGAYLSCALYDVNSFDKYMHTAGSAAIDEPNAFSAKRQMHVDFEDYVGTVDVIVRIEKQFGHKCLGHK